MVLAPLETFKLIIPLEYIIAHLLSAQVGIKVSPVTALPGLPGEQIITYTSGKFYETKNIVGVDPITKIPDWIVTQKSGEKMVVKDKDFKNLYQKIPTNASNNTYYPKGGKRFFIRVNENIQFKSPWNETQFLKTGGVLVVLSKDNIYGIQKEEFEKSYEILREENGREGLKNLLNIS